MNTVPASAEMTEELDHERAPLPGERRRIWVAYPPALYLRVARLAQRQGVSVPALIRRAVRELISEESKR